MSGLLYCLLRKKKAKQSKIIQARGAPATGGMAANIVTGPEVVENVIKDKKKEIEAGVDGFLIYDLKLAEPCRKLWQEYCSADKGDEVHH